MVHKIKKIRSKTLDLCCCKVWLCNQSTFFNKFTFVSTVVSSSVVVIFYFVYHLKNKFVHLKTLVILYRLLNSYHDQLFFLPANFLAILATSQRQFPHGTIFHLTQKNSLQPVHKFFCICNSLSHFVEPMNLKFHLFHQYHRLFDNLLINTCFSIIFKSQIFKFCYFSFSF